MKVFALLLIIFVGFFQAVYAQDILLSTNQTEYYFHTGENAKIPIEINNTYGKQISGILQYTLSQLINQGNVQLSSYNTEKKSLSINEEINNVSLDIGKSDSPSNFTVSLNFNYNENGNRIVSLGPIMIHFVSDNSQKGSSQQNKMQSSSQPYSPSKQQDLFTQQQQQMEQNLNELLGNQLNSSQNQQNQQKLQNNQMTQDTNSLKQQLEKQVQNQQEIKKEFEKKLLDNNDFLNRHQMLLKNGYNISNSNYNTVSNDTGAFDVKYNNKNGKWATLEGTMKNGTITEMKEQTQDNQEKLLEKLKQNLLYQKYNDKLLGEGFSQNNIAFKDSGNETSILLKYENQNHNNAEITATFVDGEIKKVTLEDKTPNPLNLILLVIIFVAIGSTIIIYFIIKKFKNKKRFTINDSSPIPKVESFDNTTKSKDLMDKAIQYYAKGDYKEAFGTAGKSIRLFLGHELGIKREMTSEELLRLLEKSNYWLDDIRECLKITELVEFAKSNATEDDFKKIVSLFKKLSDEQKFSKK